MELQRVTLDGDKVTVLKGGAALLSTATKADGFVMFPSGQESFEEGTKVVVHLYD